MTLQEKTLFRGKRVGDDTWVEGNYVNCLMDANAKESRHYIVEYPGEFHEIYTSTVGQYTGLRDRADKMLFEGDIIESQSEYVDRYGTGTGRMCIQRFEVKRGRSGWVESKVFDSRGKFIPSCKGLKARTINRNRSIVGNIYDNPELMQS